MHEVPAPNLPTPLHPDAVSVRKINPINPTTSHLINVITSYHLSISGSPEINGPFLSKIPLSCWISIINCHYQNSSKFRMD